MDKIYYNLSIIKDLYNWDSFDKIEPCSIVSQPIRQEEELQKSQSSEEYIRAYKNIIL